MPLFSIVPILAFHVTLQIKPVIVCSCLLPSYRGMTSLKVFSCTDEQMDVRICLVCLCRPNVGLKGISQHMLMKTEFKVAKFKNKKTKQKKPVKI